MVGVLVLLAVVATGCSRRTPRATPRSAPRAAPFTPSLEVEGVHWPLPDRQGRLLWEMDAERGKGATATGQAELQDVRCKVYDRGRLALVVSAPRVRADYQEKRLYLLGGVEARASDGRRSFRADRVLLRVEQERRAVIEAEGAVRLQVNGLLMSAERLVTDPRLSEGRLE